MLEGEYELSERQLVKKTMFGIQYLNFTAINGTINKPPALQLGNKLCSDELSRPFRAQLPLFFASHFINNPLMQTPKFTGHSRYFLGGSNRIYIIPEKSFSYNIYYKFRYLSISSSLKYTFYSFHTNVYSYAKTTA